MRGEIDQLASEWDATEEDLSSTKVQLRVMKKKAGKWSQLNEELRAKLTSVVAERDALGQEYIALKSKLEVALNEVLEAQDMLAQYMTDIEIADTIL